MVLLDFECFVHPSDEVPERAQRSERHGHQAPSLRATLSLMASISTSLASMRANAASKSAWMILGSRPRIFGDGAASRFTFRAPSVTVFFTAAQP